MSSETFDRWQQGNGGGSGEQGNEQKNLRNRGAACESLHKQTTTLQAAGLGRFY